MIAALRLMDSSKAGVMVDPALQQRLLVDASGGEIEPDRAQAGHEADHEVADHQQDDDHEPLPPTIPAGTQELGVLRAGRGKRIRPWGRVPVGVARRGHGGEGPDRAAWDRLTWAGQAQGKGTGIGAGIGAGNRAGMRAGRVLFAHGSGSSRGL